MRKFARQAAILAALALAVSGCAQQGTEGAKLAEGEKLKITQEVWTEYQDYVKYGQGLGPTGRAPSASRSSAMSGRQGLPGYYYCPRMYDGCAVRATTRSATSSTCAGARTSSA